MSESTKKFNYHAFISYRHADNKEQGRQWATWLHQAIETYEVPSDLVGKKNSRGEIIPERIYPVFRDEEELPADADLGKSIVKALDTSRVLVVLCSPQAVVSTYVADEIHHFKSIGRSDSIIASLLYGEPNASWDKGKLASGFKQEDECFPIPLQFEYNDEGAPTEKRAEPIAADFRITYDGVSQQGWCSPEAYRQQLESVSQLDKTEIQKRITSYQQQLHLMLLKIIAGIMGVPLRDLTQRDKEYQLELAKQKAKKLRRWLSAVALLAVIAIAAGVFAFFKQEQAVKAEKVAVEQKQIAEQNLAQAYAGYGRREFEDKQFENALTYFLHANQLDPNAISYKEEYQAFNQSAKKSWSKQLGLRFDTQPYVSNNAHYAVGIQDGKVSLYDLIKVKKLYSYNLPDDARYVSMVSDDGENIIEYNLDQQHFRMVNWRTNEETSLNYLKEYKFIIVLPHDDDELLLVISLDGSFRIVNSKTRQVYSYISAEQIEEYQAGYIDKIKKDPLEALNLWKYNYYDKVRTLVLDTGLTVRFDLTHPEKIKTSISPPFLGDFADKISLSFDGKLLASVEISFCLLKAPNDWLKVARQVDIWDLNSQQKIESLPLKWSFEIEPIYTDTGCGNENYDQVISDEIRSKVITINNRLGGLGILSVESRNKVNIAWDTIVRESSAPIPMMEYNKRPLIKNNIHPLRSSEVGTWVYQSRPVSEGGIEKNSYWLFQLKAMSKDSPSPSSQFAMVANLADMSVSIDERFISTLTTQGNLVHYFAETGNILKTNRNEEFSSPFHATNICATEDSHEVILSSSYSVWRYNWLKNKTIWQVDFEDVDGKLFSCESNISGGEISLVFLDPSNPWSSLFSSNKSSPLKDTSRILRIDMQGKLLTEPDLSRDVLNYPLKVKYTTNFGEMYIAQIGGTVSLYDFVNQKITNTWFLDKADGFSSVSSIAIDKDNLVAYVGYTNGKIYRLEPKEKILVASLTMPVLEMIVQNGKLIVDTGYDPKYKEQSSHLANLPKESRKSYTYKVDLKSLKMNKMRGYGDSNTRFVKYLSQGEDKILYSFSGKLQQIKTSIIDSAILTRPQKENTNLVYYDDFKSFSINRTTDKINFGITGTDEQGHIPHSPGSQLLFSISNTRNWALISTSYQFNDIHKSYLVNLNQVKEPIHLGDFELAINQRLELTDFSHKDNKLIICDTKVCKIFRLEQSTNMIEQPIAVIEQPELFSRVRFSNDDVLVNTLSGKLQKWKFIDGQYVLDKEEDKHFYKGVLFDHQADKLIVVTRTEGVILSSDLNTVHKKIKFNFNSNPIVAADLVKGWAVTVNTNFDSFNVSASLIDLNSGAVVAYFDLPISAVPSLSHDEQAGKLFWTSLEGQLASWNVDVAFSKAKEYASQTYAKKIHDSKQINGLSINGINLQQEGSQIQSKNYYELLGLDYSSYAAWNFNNSWVDQNQPWLSSAQQLFDIKNWEKQLVYSGDGASKIAKQTKINIDQLEKKITSNLTNNLGIGLLVSQLKKLSPDHIFVDYAKVKKISESNPYTAFLKGKQLLEALSKKTTMTSSSLKPRLAGLVMSSAVLSGKFYEAYTIYMNYPQILVPLNNIQQTFTMLSINGYYDETLSILEKEINKLQQMEMDKKGSFAYQGYQFLLRFQAMVKPLKKRRAEISKLPTLCLNDIQDGSVLLLSEWKKGDCVSSIKGENYFEGPTLWKHLQQSLGLTDNYAKVWREGKEVQVKIPNSLNGGMWQSMGYNGQNVLLITAMNENSPLKELGIQTFDYLVAIDDEILPSPAMLAHHITDNHQDQAKDLWVFRAASKVPRSSANSEILEKFKQHPLAYWQGELFKIKLPKDQRLGIAVEPFQVLSPREIP